MAGVGQSRSKPDSEKTTCLKAVLQDAPSSDVGSTQTPRTPLAMPESFEGSQTKIERALREWVKIVDALPDPLFAHDADYRIMRANNAYAARAGMDVRDVVGKLYWQLFPKSDGPRPVCTRVTGGLHAEEEELQLPSGETFNVRYLPFADEAGDYSFSIHLMRDVTELKRQEQIKEQYMATVGHELRTPVTSMKGSLDILTAEAAAILPDSLMHLLEIARRNCQRLICLTNDFLDLEKIGSGRMVFDLQPLEVRALVEEEIEAIQGFATPYGVRVQLDPAAAQAVARADSMRLAQAVTNLLSNAVKYSPRGAEVVVGIENLGSMIRIWVRDRGPGIPDEFKARIFQKFAQVDTPEARKKGGTGLGLAIVKEIVEKHDGEVGFEPAPGGGTIFHITVPRCEQPLPTT